MPGNSLSVSLEARLDKLEKNFTDAVKLADDAVHKIEDGFKNANPDASGMLESFKASAEAPAKATGAAIGALIAGAIGSSIAVGAALFKTIEGLSAIGDRSQDLRLPVNMLQSLGVAATEARVPVDKLNSALDEFSKVSKQDEDDASKFYKALGNINTTSVEAFKNATTQAERLGIVSNALKSTTDEVKRAQLAVQAFGTDNERVIQLLGSGAQSFELYRQNAAKLGLQINESLVEKSKEAKSQLSLLSRVMTDELSTAAANLIPVLVKMLPLLQAITLAAQATSDIFATDATASTRQMRDELDFLIDRWAKAKIERDALVESLQSGRKELDPSGLAVKSLRTALGIGPLTAEDLKTLDDDIKNIQDRINYLRKQIASNEAAPAKGPPAFKPRASLSDTSSSRDRFDAAADAIQKRAAALDAETDSINKGTAAREAAKIAAQLETVAKQINIEAGIKDGKLTDEQVQKIDAMASAYGRAAAAIENARSPLATFARESENIGKQLNQFATTSLNTVTTELASVVTGTKSAADAFKSMATSIINDLVKIAIQKSITGPIAGALFGTGGFNVSGGSGGSGGGFPFEFGLSPGQNAGGTDNWSGGPTWVGEKGPELLNLPKGSQIIPNDVAKGMGGVSMQFNVQNYADATVSTGPARRDGNGNVSIDLVIDRIVAKNALDPGSASSRALSQRGQLARR